MYTYVRSIMDNAYVCVDICLQSFADLFVAQMLDCLTDAKVNTVAFSFLYNDKCVQDSMLAGGHVNCYSSIIRTK